MNGLMFKLEFHFMAFRISAPQGAKKHESSSAERFTYQELVLENRDAAHRVGRSLLRRWGFILPVDERNSAIDIALCEAALTYDPARGTSLITWFYYSFKGELGRILSERFDPCSIMNPKSLALDAEESPEGESVRIQLTSPEPSPERCSFVEELRRICRQALGELSELERLVILETYLGDEKVAKLARRLGYSRGHLSLVKNSSARRFCALVRQSHSDLTWDTDLPNPEKEAA